MPCNSNDDAAFSFIFLMGYLLVSAIPWLIASDALMPERGAMPGLEDGGDPSDARGPQARRRHLRSGYVVRRLARDYNGHMCWQGSSAMQTDAPSTDNDAHGHLKMLQLANKPGDPANRPAMPMSGFAQRSMFRIGACGCNEICTTLAKFTTPIHKRGWRCNFMLRNLPGCRLLQAWLLVACL